MSESRKKTKTAPGNENAWKTVCQAREASRPKGKELAYKLFDGLIELHGDRRYGDDPAVFTAIGWLNGQPVTVIAQCKGTSVEENIDCHFGMPLPEGYRKGLRQARLAARFGRPIITIVDTPGAYPGAEAEMRGQMEAIAACLAEFSALPVPIVCLVLSEGGSGGALAFTMADAVLLMENCVYSVLSPEGFASILWKDASRKEEAASLMGLTARELRRQGFGDEIIQEPEGGLSSSSYETFHLIKQAIDARLQLLMKKKPAALVAARRAKWKRMCME